MVSLVVYEIDILHIHIHIDRYCFDDADAGYRCFVIWMNGFYRHILWYECIWMFSSGLFHNDDMWSETRETLDESSCKSPRCRVSVPAVSDSEQNGWESSVMTDVLLSTDIIWHNSKNQVFEIWSTNSTLFFESWNYISKLGAQLSWNEQFFVVSNHMPLDISWSLGLE